MPSRSARLSPKRETILQFTKVVASGGASTFVYFAFLNLLRFGLGWTSFWSVTGAWVIATGSNYVLNRYWSFRLRGKGTAAETGAFYIVSLGAWAATVGIVQLAEARFGPLGPLGLNLTNIFADAVLLIPKFVAFRQLVFRRSLR
jgi:putative flippase GtrA